jgi:nicotinamidase/pyrazinamidase
MDGNSHLFIVDPQNDFCDPRGALYVDGAEKDMERLAAFVRRTKDRWSAIHVTLDSHHLFDVDHPIFWKDPRGNPPSPFTTISVADVETGRWTPAVPTLRDRMLRYVRDLDANGRYPLTIWPPHCLIGSWGHNVYAPLYEALLDWERGLATIDYTLKGMNPYTEHYSVVQADVPDEFDPSTLPNRRLIEAVREADLVVVAGEALSHCVANTMRDLARHLGEHHVGKVVLLRDCTSPVKGFEKEADRFLEEMTVRGMRTAESAAFRPELRRTGTES